MDPPHAPPDSVGGPLQRLDVDVEATQVDVLCSLVTAISIHFSGERVVGVRPTEAIVTVRVAGFAGAASSGDKGSGDGDDGDGDDDDGDDGGENGFAAITLGGRPILTGTDKFDVCVFVFVVVF